jgi:putative transposase
LVDDPVAYRWSSCSLFSEEHDIESFIKPEFILNIISNEQNKKAGYSKMLKRLSGMDMGNVLEKQNAIESLQSKLTAIFPNVIPALFKKNRVAQEAGIDLLSDKELDHLVQKAKNQGIARSPESRKAKKFVIDQLVARGYSQSEIAERLGVCRKTVYNLLNSTA